MMSYSANIKKPNESKSTAVHELGHSLGWDDLTFGTAIQRLHQ